MVIEFQNDEALPEKNNTEESKVAELELALQNASLAHEYTRLELESARSFYQEMELTEKLESYKKAYFTARKSLEDYNPLRLEELEKQIISQKKEVFTFYSA